MEQMSFSEFISDYNTLYKEGNRLYHRLAKHFGLSDTAFWILYSLKESNTALTQTELCSTLCLSKQTINSALKILANEGYILLEAPHHKSRSKYISLTSSGRELTKRTIDPIFCLEERAYEGLSETERKTLLTLIHRYLNLLCCAAQPILTGCRQEGPVSNAD